MNKSRKTSSTIFRGHPRWRSVESRPSSRSIQSIFSGTGVSHTKTVDGDDYSDVFGGPPRSLLVHKFSNSDSFYEEIIRMPEFTPPAEKCDISLPVFRIPARNEGFFSDIFGSDDDRKSRERSGSLSQANSSSALSSEELSPCRPIIADDVPLSVLASNLRPISVPWKWNSSTMVSKEYPSKQEVSFFPCNNVQSFENNEYKTNFKSSPRGFSKRVSSPETISLGSSSYQGVKVFADDSELNSQSESKCSFHDHVLSEQITQQEEEEDDGESGDDYSDDDDDFMSSYVIEINSDLRKGECEASDIDEAIAWAKEKFQSGSSDKEPRMKNNSNEQTVQRQGSSDASEYYDNGIGKVQPPKKQQTETEKLDENIRMWSYGKETDIRLLLSTLHYILWPESGWYAISLVNLKENSQVKRAYQKARLCLHPDKLQQKGETFLHKYVAEQAFSILQDAWGAFISEDVSI